MKRMDIRARLLLTALLPVTTLGLVLAAVFLLGWVTDVSDAHQQRARLMARQMASASEYGLFSGNTAHLQSVVSGARQEPDVVWVGLVNPQGQLVAQSGRPPPSHLPTLTAGESLIPDALRRQDWLVQPVLASQIPLDDLFDAGSPSSDAPPPLGHVVIAFSRETLDQREQRLIWVGVAVTLAGMLFGGVLAWRLGRGLIEPIMEVSAVIDRIARGNLSARALAPPDDPMRDLKLGVNHMAMRLEQGRDELEQRIAMATRALRERTEEAETATLAKSRFLAAASHDLRQPTHALGMFVARLSQLPHDDETRQLISHLETSVQAMQALLDALLDISRLDAKSVQVRSRPFALSEVFAQLSNSLTPLALQQGVRLRILPTTAWLLTDPALLSRILLNLVSNALRYTPQGTVLVTCRRTADGQHARLQVWDSGIGIAPEDHEAVFREFYQVGNRERDQGKGLGLGLNIVQRTARLLGLPLQLRSALGCGSRFSVLVPLAPITEGQVHQLAPIAEPNDPLRGLGVLVIEDNALVREGLVGLLRSWGCEVGVADGQAEALQLLLHGPQTHVLISDYRLGHGNNGIDLIQHLRHTVGWALPACLISGDTDPAVIHSAQQAGLTLLHKPVRPAKLRSLLRRLAAAPGTGGPAGAHGGDSGFE